MRKALGRLERVDLRDVWLSEATEFTPWLAQPDNLAILADAVGFELELEAQERNVGPFRADILCKDVETGHWVLIENQLERTDHSHLGQLLTYASGLQAVTIIWIAAKFTEQHRATLDWLNEITDDRFGFFGLEVELWRIGDSLAAPNFNIVSKPNDWARDVNVAARAIAAEPLTDTRQKQLAYWTQWRERLDKSPGNHRSRKPAPQHWLDFSIGRSDYWISATLNAAERRAGIELNMRNSPENKGNFEALLAQKDAVEAEFGMPLAWLPLSGKKSSRVAAYKMDIDPLNESNWPEMLDWMQVTFDRFQQIFRSRIRLLPECH
jgi:hypothetical protein